MALSAKYKGTYESVVGGADGIAALYKKSSASKVKKIGHLTTGGSTYALHYRKGKVYGYRMADIHTICMAKVKKGKLVLSGMYDNSYAPNLAFRHFSGYKPAVGVALSDSKALGAKGTQKQYRALSKKCYSAPKLKLYANTKPNRAKRMK